MTSRGLRLPALGSVAVLALALGLSGCGGGKDEPKKEAKPTVSAGVTLTPSGERLKFGQVANLAWAPDQNTKGLVAVTVEQIREGTKSDVERIEITPKPENPHLYYVTLKITNLGSVDLGGQNAAGLPLFLDEGTDLLNRAALLPPKMKFEPCPKSALPEKFPKGEAARVCLVYVPSSPVQRMMLQPAAGDVITWPGDVVKPSPSASPSGKKGASAKPKTSAKPSAKASGADNG